MECFEQANLMQDIPAYELVMKVMRLHGNDPDMEFACALITKWPSRDEHREHLRKATAEAKNGSFLLPILLSISEEAEDPVETLG